MPALCGWKRNYVSAIGEFATIMYLTDVGATCVSNKAHVPSASLYCIWTSHECTLAAAWKGLLCELLRGFFATSFYAVCQEFLSRAK